MEGNWPRLHHRYAKRQHGVVTLAQALECGIAASTFHRHVRVHGWVRLHRSVWAVPWSSDSFPRRAAAALLTVGQHGVLTGCSALHLMGAATMPRDVGVLVPPESHLHTYQGIRYSRGRWVPGERPVRVDGLRCASGVRALTDCAALHDAADIERVIAALDRLRIASPADVAAFLDKRVRFPGRAKVKAAVEALASELTHSLAERTGRRLLREAQLVLAPHPRPLLITDGQTRVGEIDIPFPQVRYGVEVDGPHHQLPEVAAADKRRDRRLAQLGWVIDRFGVEEIEQSPQVFVRHVAAGLQAALSRAIDPWPGAS